MNPLERSPESSSFFGESCCNGTPCSGQHAGYVAGLQPHRVETFKLSKDPLFIEKVRDIVGLCLAPPDRALVPGHPALQENP